MNRKQKRMVIAIFFLVVPLLTVSPFLLFRSPSPDRLEFGIAVCDPEFNPGPQAQAVEEPIASYRNFVSRLDEILLAESTDRSSFMVLGGLLSYDRNLAGVWVDVLGQEDEVTAISKIVAEAQRVSSNPNYAPCVVR